MSAPASVPPRPSWRDFFGTAAGVALWVTAILCVAYLPMFLGKIVFLRDPAHWNYPARWFVRESLLRGDSPLWNPEQGLGFSVVANPLYGLYYPPHWLYLVTPRSLVASMATWQAFAHLVWGTLGMVALARRLGLPAVAAGIAGLAWGLSGYTTAAWTAGLLLSAGAWLPWVAVGFIALARHDGRQWGRAVAGATLPLAMALLFGEVFAAAMSVLFGVALTAIVVDTGGRSPWLTIRRVGAAIAATVALAGGIAAVVILPARQIAAATARAQALPRWVAEVCSLHPLRIIEMVAPGSMGYPFSVYPGAEVVGDKRLDGLPLMYSVYLGASVVILAIAALRRRRLPALLGVATVVALLVSFGRHTPIHQWLRTVVRPLAYMRYPEKYMVWVVGFCSLLAGLGAARVLGERSTPWRRTVVALLALAGLALVAPALFPRPWAPYVIWGAIKGAVAIGFVLVVQSLVARAADGGLARAVAPALLVAVVSGDLACAAWPFLDFAPAQLATAVPPAAQVLTEDNRRRSDILAPPRVYRADRTEATIRKFAPPRSAAEWELHSMQTLIPNVVTTFGIATLPGYDAALPQLLPQLWQSGQKVGQGVLRLLGVDYAVLPIDDPRDPVEHRRGLQPLMDPLPGARLYRVPSPLPRVYLAGRADALDDEAALAQLFEPDVVEGARVLVASGAGGAPLPTALGRPGVCSLVAFKNTELVARCRADRDAMAVFIEQYDAGWRATVDGAAAPLLRANLLMRAVRLSAGEHVITLSYTPPGLRLGATVSGLSLLSLIALSLPRRRRKAHTCA
jgi:hypothetical protein